MGIVLGDKVRVTFQVKMFCCMSATCSLVVLLFGWIVFCWSEGQLSDSLGQRARVQASEIALLPELKPLISQRDTYGLKKLLDPLSKNSDASFITIGDSTALRLYHSFSPETVNLPMIGGDNAEVLQGKIIISDSKGGAGVSLRSKAPVLDVNHHVIGIVSVGYLRSYMDIVNQHFLLQLLLFSAVLVPVLFLISWIFTRHLKKLMFRLEPGEIAALVRQNMAILEAVYEGIVVTDLQGRLIAINQAARRLFSIEPRLIDLKGLPASQFFRSEEEMFGSNAHHSRTDELVTLNNIRVIYNRVPFSVEGVGALGWVFSFRDQNDINVLSMRLNEVTRFADNLRILRHEQINWTATLTGMLQMERYDEALNFIAAQSQDAQAVIDHINRRIVSPVISGLLMGKYAQAKERGVRLWLDPGSQLKKIPETVTEHDFISLLGNLLDNAIDTTVRVCDEKRPIEVYLSDINGLLTVEVSDYGAGIKDGNKYSIFEKGFSSKKELNECDTGARHGIGLYVVEKIVREASGEIEITQNVPAGTVFSVFIPFKASNVE